MEAMVKKYILPDSIGAPWARKMALSLIAPLCILALQPLGLTLRQSGVLAAVVLTIIWWSADIVKKIPASFFLLAVFWAVSGAGFRKVFSFPLSETFPMLVVTYLFSRAISNAGISERMIQPVLERTVHTAFACIPAVIVTFFLMIYVVPQPLARLIIVAGIFENFLKKARLPADTRSVLLFAVFLFYAVVNMSAKDADLIMNYVAADFSPVEITNGIWAREMLVPTIAVCLLVAGLFCGLFYRQLAGRRISVERGEARPFSKQEKLSAVIIFTTVLLWMTQGIHGINSTLITLVSVLLLFGIKTLRIRDVSAIDGTTLIFLTAAFSIGGVMEACGAADKVFGLFAGVFPEKFSVVYLWIMVGITMALHMLLGSNTTALSVAIPGMLILCEGQVPPEVIVFTAIVSVSFHTILPFHSGAMMIGAANGYFPAGYVAKFGLPATFLVYLAAAAVYLPYWKLTGLL